MKIQSVILVSLVVIGMVSAYTEYEYPGDRADYNPYLPYVYKRYVLPGLYDKVIVFVGIPHANASSWQFNLEMSNTNCIAFHFDVRIDTNDGRKVIVRNSKPGDGNWQTEERLTLDFPFIPDEFFEVRIIVEADRFKVAVNNIHLLDFVQRLEPMTDIDILRIDGDLRLAMVRVLDRS